MANEFDISFQKAYKQASDFQVQLMLMGKQLDKNEVKAKASQLAHTKLFTAISRESDKARTHLEGLLKNTEAAGKVAAAAERQTVKSLQGIAQAHLNAATQANAYKGASRELKQILDATAKDKALIASYQALAAQSEKLRGENRLLSAQLKNIASEEAKLNVSLKDKIKTQQNLLAHNSRLILTGKELNKQVETSAGMQAKHNDKLTARLQATRRANAEDVRWSASIREQERVMASLNGGMQEQLTRLQARNSARRKEISDEERAQVVSRKSVSLRERENAIMAKQSSTLLDLRAHLNSLTSEEAKEIAQLKVQTASREKALSADARQSAQLAELRDQYARLQTVEGREIAVLQGQISARKKYLRTLGEDAAASKSLSAAKQELNRAHEQEANKLARLQAQSKLLTTEYGKQTAALQRQIKEQREYNHLLTLSTAELLGFSNAQRRSNSGFNSSAQAAAMLRAGVTGLHASFGMYTSATILAATATYAFTASLRDAVATGIDFTGNMQRSQAVMMTSADSYRNVSMEMGALEAQVRALGATTSFTGSEVAKGLVDLGMAGLSSSDSLTALEPTLRLASVGAIDMGQSADIATNVMTSFSKSAGDLTDIVDVMATAVTNSNTSIGQLANALTYVGPAADAAGFSLRDTVAAVELLSNAGIKSSKAGTGLRRFMLNIQNPTAKGKKVLDEYGIAITNIDGSTRDLNDILGQFHTALYNDVINPGERTGAVMDLVGVRAQSAVSRLVGSADEFAILRAQLDNVTGAAEKMRLTIEDFAGGDLKKLSAAFEEMELTAFEKFEPVIRRVTMEMTTFLQALNEPIEEGSPISKMEGYIADFLRFGETALWVVGAVAGWKVFNSASTLMAGFSETNVKGARNLEILGARFGTTATSATVMNASLARTTVVGNLANATFVGMNVTASTGAAALSRLAAAAAWLGTTLSVVARVAAWGAAIYMVGSAISSAFGSSTQSKVEDYNNLIEESKTRHAMLEHQVEKTAQAMKVDAMEKQAAAILSNITSLSGLQLAYRNTLTAMEDGSQGYVDAEARLNALTEQSFRYQNQLAGINMLLEGSNSSLDSVESLAQQQDVLAVEIASTTERLEEQREAYHKIIGMPNKVQESYELRDAIAASNDVLENLVDRFGRLGEKIDEAKGKMVDFAAQTKAAFTEAYREAKVDIFVDNMSTSQGLEYIRAQRRETEQLLDVMQEASSAGQDFYVDDFGNEKKLDRGRVNEAEDLLRELGERQAELEYEQLGHADELNEALEERRRLQLSEVELQQDLRSELSKLKEEQGDIPATDLEALAENVKRQNEITSELKKSNEEGNKYTSKLEEHRKMLAEMVELRGDYNDAATNARSEVDALQATNDLLYDNYETEAQRLALVETLLNREREASVLYENMAERQEKMREQQERINELQAAAVGKTGKARRDAEEAVSKALQAQRDLVKDQVADQISLIEAAKDRVIEVEGQVAELERQRHMVELAKEYAAQGREISLQESERLQGLRALSLEIENQQDALADAKAAAASLSGQELEANQTAQEYLREHISLLQQRQELESSPATNAAELLDAYDGEYQKMLQLQEAESELMKLRDGANDPKSLERYTKALENVRSEMDDLALSSDNFGERMGDALELIVTSLQDEALSFEDKMLSGARGTAVLAEGLRTAGDEGSDALHALTIATDIQNLSAAVGAVVNQGFGDPYTAFGRMAAMAAAVASLGFNVGSISGGGMSSEEASEKARESQTFGSVLGDSKSASKSIENAVDVTAEATSELVGINRSMLEALQNVQEGISGAVTLIARDVTNPDMGGQNINTNFIDQMSDWASEVPLIGDLLGGAINLLDGIGLGFIGGALGGKAKKLDDGLVIDGGAIQDVINNTVVNSYTEWKEKKHAFDDYDTKRRTERVDSSVERQFGLVFESLYDSVAAGVENLGMLPGDVQTRLDAFVLETTEVSLDGLDPEEQKQHINDVFSRTFDGMAEQVTPFLVEMQQAGEGLGETLARVSTQVQVGQEAVDRLGFEFSLDNSSGTTEAIQATAEAFEYLSESSGGLEAFVEGMNEALENFASRAHQFQVLTADVTNALAQQNIVLPETRNGYWELIQAQDAATTSGADNIATLLRLQETADTYYSQLETLEESYRDRFYSETEKASFAFDEMAEDFKELGLKVPVTSEAFRELIEAQDKTTESGRNVRAQLLGLVDGFLDVESAVKSAYESLLDREADTSGLTYWIAQIEAGTLTLGEVADYLASSVEAVENTIRKAYEENLGRAPGSDDLAYWLERVESGALSASDAVENIANSAEALEFAANGGAEAMEALAVAMDKRKSLEEELFNLQATTAEKRQKELQVLRELDATGEANLLGIQERIWAYEDEKEALDNAKQAQERYSQAVQSAQSKLASFSSGVTDWLAQLDATKSGTGTPRDRLEASDADFWSQYEKALQGDRSAQQGITQYADRYIANLKEMYASSTPGVEGIAEIRDAMERLPELLSPEQFLAEEFRNIIGEQTDSLTAKLDLNRDGVVSAIEKTITKDWNNIDVLKTVLYQEMQKLGAKSLTAGQVRAALAPHATDEEIRRLIERVDHNGDGIINQEEITGSRIAGLSMGIVSALAESFRGIDVNASGFIDYDEFANAFDGLATDSTLERLFQTVDKNGDGQISYLESIAASSLTLAELSLQRQPGDTDDVLGGDPSAIDDIINNNPVSDPLTSKIDAAYQDVMGEGAKGFQITSWANWLSQKDSRAGQLHQAVAWANLPLGGEEWLKERGLFEAGMPKFAKGSAFESGSVLSTPTRFNIGEMAEEGPEAIMPLARGPGGSLGVRTVGGRSNSDEKLIAELRESNANAKKIIAVMRYGFKKLSESSDKSESHLKNIKKASQLAGMAK